MVASSTSPQSAPMPLSQSVPALAAVPNPSSSAPAPPASTARKKLKVKRFRPNGIKGVKGQTGATIDKYRKLIISECVKIVAATYKIGQRGTKAINISIHNKLIERMSAVEPRFPAKKWTLADSRLLIKNERMRVGYSTGSVNYHRGSKTFNRIKNEVSILRPADPEKDDYLFDLVSGLYQDFRSVAENENWHHAGLQKKMKKLLKRHMQKTGMYAEPDSENSRP